MTERKEEGIESIHANTQTVVAQPCSMQYVHDSLADCAYVQKGLWPLTMTTEGWAGCCLVAVAAVATALGSSSSLSSSMPSERPSTSLTVSSMVACLAFTVSILHLEWSEAICSWQPRIFWASSCQNIPPRQKTPPPPGSGECGSAHNRRSIVPG